MSPACFRCKRYFTHDNSVFSIWLVFVIRRGPVWSGLITKRREGTGRSEAKAKEQDRTESFTYSTRLTRCFTKSQLSLQRSTAQHSTAQHSTAQHSTARRENCPSVRALDCTWEGLGIWHGSSDEKTDIGKAGRQAGRRSLIVVSVSLLCER